MAPADGRAVRQRTRDDTEQFLVTGGAAHHQDRPGSTPRVRAARWKFAASTASLSRSRMTCHSGSIRRSVTPISPARIASTVRLWTGFPDKARI
jgi:hypothetical protein